MTQRTIRDRSGRFDISLEVYSEDLEPAIRHEDAEAVLRSAILLAFAVLMQSDRWPDEALRSMSSFMEDMRESLLH